MSNLLNIGTSGLLAYRQQLTTTAENIANANTEGYHHRSVSRSELAGATGTILNVNSSGQGVRVEEIRRTFNTFIAENVRSAQSALGSLTALKPSLETIEARITPGPGGLLESMDGFFDALSSLSVAPDDMGLRAVVMSAATSFASTVTDMGHIMARTQTSIEDEMNVSIDRANVILGELRDLHARLRVKADSTSANPMYDRRDLLLEELSNIIKVTVALNDEGMATIKLGTSDNGPVLLEGIDVASLTTNGKTISVHSPRVGDVTQVRYPEGGKIQGYAQALSSLSNARGQVNAWAQAVADNMNFVHQNGLDSNNQYGKEMFSLMGWDAFAATINRGNASAQVEITKIGEPPSGDMRAVYNGETNLWTIYDDAENALGSGSTRITVSGVQIDIDGQGVNGDVIELRNSAGDAKNMRFVLQSSDQIAAAGSLTVSSRPDNVSDATLDVIGAAILSDTGAAELSDIPAAAMEKAHATTFLNAGVVGRIPASAGSADLTSYGTLAQTDFTPPLVGGSMMNLSFAGQTHSFDLTTAYDGTPVVAATDAELVGLINNGTIRNQDGQTAAQLGLGFAASQNHISVSLAEGDFDNGGSLDGQSGTISQTAADASELMLFTREGRQIAGPILTQAEAAALFTLENGFYPTASYTTDALNQTQPGYRGVTMTQNMQRGNFVATIGSGFDVPTWDATNIAPTREGFTLQMAVDGRSLPNIDIPQGASAGEMAQLLSEKSDLQVTAQTALRLSAPTDGILSMTVAGDNTDPVTISAMIDDGRLDDFATQINQISGKTGIIAETSFEGGTLILRHTTGADIELGNVTHSAGDMVTLERVDSELNAISAPITLGGAVQSARFTGTVELASQSAFSAATDDEAVIAETTVFNGGLITRQMSQAGSVQEFDFAFSPQNDGASEDAIVTRPGGTFYEMQLGGDTGPKARVSADAIEGTTPGDVARAMRDALRASAPTARATGAALDALPQNGAQLAFRFAGEGYLMRMVEGVPMVEGPEAGRVTAQVNADGAIELLSNGGSLDGAGFYVDPETPNASLFGFAASDMATTEIIGQSIDLDALPQGTTSFEIRFDGETHLIHVSRVGDQINTFVSGDFPGQADFDAELNAITLNFSIRSPNPRISAQENAVLAGFGTADGRLDVTAEGKLRLIAQSDTMPRAEANVISAGAHRLSLDNLPNEDLIVVLGAPGDVQPGALQLGSSFTPNDDYLQSERDYEIKVIDAESGQIEVLDPETGHSIATRYLDENGATVVAGYALSVEGELVNGDQFTLSPRSTGTGDARNIETLVDLRSRDPDTGMGGFTEIFNKIVSTVGGQVAAAEARTLTTNSEMESAKRAQADATGVDLDKEAATLMEQQQAYQANAQVISVARSLFETLLSSL